MMFYLPVFLKVGLVFPAQMIKFFTQSGAEELSGPLLALHGLLEDPFNSNVNVHRIEADKIKCT
jgi:hypothetical protein